MAIQPINILIRVRDEFSSALAGMQSKVLLAGAAIAGVFGIALFKGAVTSAAELEAQLSDVQAVSGATKDEMLLLRKAAEEAGSTTKFTATEAAEALGNLARSGLTANQSIAALPATLNLAQAGSIDLAQASTLMTRTLAGFGLAATEAGRVSDLLAMGANASNTSVTGLGEALSYAAPTASAMGISLESTLAIIGKFADGGIDASRAGTALNSILSQFGDPASSFRKELAGAGITTGNFETALVQLAGAGDKGKNAIRAVGTEAAPALQSLINQGVPALEALRQKLVESGGSAATFAEQVENNLTGATKNLGSAWDNLKITLGTPVLPILKDAVTELATSLRNAVSDGTVGKFGDAIAKGFQAALEWARRFLAEVDFAAIGQNLRDSADKVGAAFDVIREKAENAGDIVRLTWGAMSAGVNTVLAAVFTVGEAFALVARDISTGIALLREGLAAVSFGSLSAGFKEAAQDARIAAEGFGGAADALAEKARQALAGMEKGAQMARDGFAGLTGETTAAEAAATRSKPAFDALGQSVGGAANQDKLTAFKALEDATQKVGDKATQAAGKVQELGKASQQVGTDAKQTAQEIEAAFTRMGINTQSSLQAAAENSRKDFETIKNSGQATADGLQQAFKRMADAAAASGDAGQLAFVRSQAAAQGFEVATDSAGKTTVRAMNDAAAATGGAGRAADGAAGSYQRMGQSAADAAEQAAKLAAINERYSRPGENSQQKAPGEKDFDPGRGSPFSRPGEDPRNGNGLTQAEFQRKEKLKGQGSLDMSLQFDMLAKLQNNTLTAADLPQLKNVVVSLRQNQANFDAISPGLNSLQALADDRKWANAVQGFERFIRDAEAVQNRPAQSPAVDRRSPSGTTTPSTTFVSNITLPGAGTTRLNFADAGSQREAEALLRQLTQARGASS